MMMVKNIDVEKLIMENKRLVGENMELKKKIETIREEVIQEVIDKGIDNCY